MPTFWRSEELVVPLTCFYRREGCSRANAKDISEGGGGILECWGGGGVGVGVGRMVQCAPHGGTEELLVS